MRPLAFKLAIVVIIMSSWLLGIVPAALAQTPVPGQFANPLGDTTFAGIIVTATKFLLGLVGFLAMAALVWGGVLYIVSLGNDDYVKQAKKVIFWAIMGLMIIVLSYAILRTVSGFLGVTTPG